jgi:serine/threonine protein kinase
MEKPRNGRYVIGAQIGNGVHGVIKEAIDLQTGKTVMVKRFLCEEHDEGLASGALREVAAFRYLSHPNIIKALDIFAEDSALFLVMPKMDTDLHHFLRDTRRGLEPEVMRRWSYQLLSALDYMHLNLMIHRDVKTRNVLVDLAEDRVLLCDFGKSSRFRLHLPETLLPVGSRQYRSPDLLMGAQTYTWSADIWALGVVFAEMAMGRQLFAYANELDVAAAIASALGGFDAGGGVPRPQLHVGRVLGIEDEPLGEVINEMMQVDPAMRPTARELLLMPYFDAVRERDVVPPPEREPETSAPKGDVIRQRIPQAPDLGPDGEIRL